MHRSPLAPLGMLHGLRPTSPAMPGALAASRLSRASRHILARKRAAVFHGPLDSLPSANTNSLESHDQIPVCWYWGLGRSPPVSRTRRCSSARLSGAVRLEPAQLVPGAETLPSRPYFSAVQRGALGACAAPEGALFCPPRGPVLPPKGDLCSARQRAERTRIREGLKRISTPVFHRRERMCRYGIRHVSERYSACVGTVLRMCHDGISGGPWLGACAACHSAVFRRSPGRHGPRNRKFRCRLRWPRSRRPAPCAAFAGRCAGSHSLPDSLSSVSMSIGNGFAWLA